MPPCSGRLPQVPLLTPVSLAVQRPAGIQRRPPSRFWEAT